MELTAEISLIDGCLHIETQGAYLSTYIHAHEKVALDYMGSNNLDALSRGIALNMIGQAKKLEAEIIEKQRLRLVVALTKEFKDKLGVDLHILPEQKE